MFPLKPKIKKREGLWHAYLFRKNTLKIFRTWEDALGYVLKVQKERAGRRLGQGKIPS